MEELYKKTLDRLKAELKKQLPEIEAMVTGSGITRRQDLKKQKPRNTVWRF